MTADDKSLDIANPFTKFLNIQLNDYVFYRKRIHKVVQFGGTGKRTVVFLDNLELDLYHEIVRVRASTYDLYAGVGGELTLVNSRLLES
jgi:hypothetical protein